MINHFVAIIENKDYPFDLESPDRKSPRDIDHVKREVERLVRGTSIRTSRKNPETIKVRVDSLKIKEGNLVRDAYRHYDIMPNIVPMTVREYEQEQDEILKNIPKEFHGVLGQMAYESGHSSGYESVISYLSELVHNFTEPIQEYRRSIIVQTIKTSI